MEKTGETAREGGELRCEKCGGLLRVERGMPIPPCPQCGFHTFELLNPRFASVEQAANERSQTRET